MKATSITNRPDMRRTFKLRAPPEALQILMDNINITTLSLEKMDTEKALGRVLAEDITAPLNSPPQNITFMDGYAVRSHDTLKATRDEPVILIIKGKKFPNDFHSTIEVSSGEAAYVACGSTIPKGADCVIRSEQTQFKNEKITIMQPAKNGLNIAYAGEDVKIGETILKRGHTIRPQDIGLLAGMAIRQVQVLRKPTIAMITVGDEMAEFSETDNEKDKILNNYSLLISSLALDIGTIPLKLGVVPDDLKAIQERVAEGLEKADIVCTVGGCSVGVKDLVPDAIDALGSPGVVMHGVTIKPGHVVGAGVVGGKPIVMLPGHVVSATMAFYLFVVPLIKRCLGFNDENILPLIKARLSRDVESGPFYYFLRAAIRKEADKIVADPVRGGSNVLSTLVASNGFTVLPPRKIFKEGDELEFTLFSRHEYADFKHKSN